MLNGDKQLKQNPKQLNTLRKENTNNHFDLPFSSPFEFKLNKVRVINY